MRSVRTTKLGVCCEGILVAFGGCTIFDDKNATSISISYLLLFHNVQMCGGYCWGVAALTHKYKQIRNAFFFLDKTIGRLCYFHSGMRQTTLMFVRFIIHE